jgi:hypothetical protein
MAVARLSPGTVVCSFGQSSRSGCNLLGSTASNHCVRPLPPSCISYTPHRPSHPFLRSYRLASAIANGLRQLVHRCRLPRPRAPVPARSSAPAAARYSSSDARFRLAGDAHRSALRHRQASSSADKHNTWRRLVALRRLRLCPLPPTLQRYCTFSSSSLWSGRGGR